LFETWSLLAKKLEYYLKMQPLLSNNFGVLWNATTIGNPLSIILNTITHRQNKKSYGENYLK